MTALLVMLVAVNPPGVVACLRKPAGVVAALAAAGATAVAVGLAAASSALLDALDVSRPTFRLAAGVVLVAASLWSVLAGTRGALAPADAEEGRRGALLVLWLAALVTPQLAAVSVSLGADDGVGAVALAASAVLALTWLASFLGGLSPVAWSAAARVVGAFGVAVGLGMVVAGVKAV